MFAESEAYERFMGRWSRRLAPEFVTFAGLHDGEAALDVGAGTGAVARAMGDLAPTATVTSVDRSSAYLGRARAQAHEARRQCVVGDARQLPFGDGVFDRTCSLLMLNFIPNPVLAVREMARVTRFGGTVAAAVWDYGHGMQMLRVFWDEAVGADPAADARDERHMPLCRRGDLAACWRTHHLAEVVETPLTVALTFSSFDDFWRPFLGGQGPAGSYVARLPESARRELQARLRQRLLGGRDDGVIVLEGRAWAVRGVVA